MYSYDVQFGEFIKKKEKQFTSFFLHAEWVFYS